MSKRQRFVATILAICLITVLIPATVMAETPVTVTVGNASGKPGDTVTVPINMAGNTGIGGIQMTIAFDNNRLEYLSSSFNSSFGGAGTINIVGNKTNIVWWAGNSANSSNGDIFTVTYKIKETAAACESPLTVDLLRVSEYEDDMRLVDAQSVSGNVSILAPDADSSPRIWIAGGNLKPDGSATVNVVMAASAAVTSGEFTLTYDSAFELQSIQCGNDVNPSGSVIKSPMESGANNTQAGTVVMNFSINASTGNSLQLMVIKFNGAMVGGRITLSSAKVEDSAGTAIAGLKLYNGAFRTATTDFQAPREVDMKIDASSGTKIDIKIGLAASNDILQNSTKSLNLCLAFIQNGRLKAISYQSAVKVTFDKNGLGNFILSAQYSGIADIVKVFILDSGETMKPCSECLECYIPS